MLYQLPNGKVVYLTTEEFLELTDQDVQYLVSLNYGEVVIDPFHKSSIRDTPEKVKKQTNDLDYYPDSEDAMSQPRRNIEDYLDESGEYLDDEDDPE